ncbi:MAG: PQQ-binding-like beta-propeller repeat protein, partial [Armatimonadota bacterium]|nr:PQQ-binding-like beta-propeller repeat protein [Armatimonadota bacterium]
YQVPGNHDQTWWPVRPLLRLLHGGVPYAFKHEGCHFIALDTAGRQDPRPALALEELNWLREYLQRVGREEPLFLFLHHPLSGSEWASPYDYERLYQVLRPYHVALMLVGHGHGIRAMKLGPYDAVMGGSTFDQKATPNSAGNAGYSIVSVQGGMLRVAYRCAVEAEATRPLLEKPLAPLPPPAAARFLAPGEGARVSGGPLTVRLAFDGASSAVSEVALDAGKPVPLSRTGGTWAASLDLKDVVQGVHVLRAVFRSGDGVTYAAREFLVEHPGGPRALWRRVLGGSVRAALAVDEERLYVGAQDGYLYALDRRNGKTRWRFRGSGEILGKPAVADRQVCVASTEGVLYALDDGGHLRWSYAAGSPLCAPPVVAAGAVVIGAADGVLHCLDWRSGATRWKKRVAAYTIESAACADGESVYVGAWDTFVYSVSLTDGSLRWKAVADGANVRAAARYYSPADCAPVLAGGRLFAADRNMKLTILNAATGERLGGVSGCSAVAAAADGGAVYLRRSGAGGAVTKLSVDGTEVWNAAVETGALPSPPTEAGGQVAVAGNTGLVSVLSAADGRVLWQYRANAGFYVPGGALIHEGVVYTAALDGSVTAISP